MNWHIVTDSSSDLFDLHEEKMEKVDFASVPFTIRVGGSEYVDDENLDIDAMLRDNETNPEAAHTACPSPQAFLDAFSQPGPVIAFTISSNLSGSYASACMARDMLLEEEEDKQIAVVDTKATGPETVLLVEEACRLIRQGAAFEKMENLLHKAAERTHIIFSLASYHNLIKNGRVNRLVGLVAGHLGFWGIGVGDDEGRIAMRGKARGEKKMIRFLVDEIKRVGLAGRHIVISHCLNADCAAQLKNALISAFQDVRVDILPTRGLDSFYAERRGLIVGF